MLELLAQIASIIFDNVGHALGRFSGRILLVLVLIIAVGCAVLVSSVAV